jgi:hypothetical protein
MICPTLTQTHIESRAVQKIMKKLFVVLGSVSAFSLVANGQILLSGGLTYSQNFDSMSNSPAAGSATWTDNATPGLEGWYASRAFTGGTTSAYGPFAYTGYRIGDGSANNGTIWSFGTIGATDRALGSLGSGTPKTNVFGVLFKNDTANIVDTLTIGYTGEQWRNGGNTVVQTLAFSYQTSAIGFTSPIGVDSAPNNGWVAFTALSFNSPNTASATQVTLDGNNAANRTVFGSTVLTGVSLNPGDSIFLRWLDIDDSGNDHGLAVDDFSFSANAVVAPEPSTAALAGLAAFGLVCWRRVRRQ